MLEWALIDANNGDLKLLFETKQEAIDKLYEMIGDAIEEAECWVVVPKDSWMF